jgi:hydroxymethylpyrimidine pyrophosphatase-like HAD family hydrolase
VGVRVIYTDLDGTLLGPGASLFATETGGISLRAAEAVASLQRAGVDLIPMSGRTVEGVREAARLLGAADFIAELGGITCYGLGREVVRHFGAFGGRGTPFEAMARIGAAGLLLEAFPGRIEPHGPWAFSGRECSMLFRGHVDLAAARSLLAEAGHDWLDLHDNGVIRRSFPGLEVPEVHAYHLVPRGVDKASAVAADLRRRGLEPDDAAAIGDSMSDAAVGEQVGTVFLVANAEASAAALPAVHLTAGAHGEGFAEAVAVLLGS